ncbi:hypothetical protein CHELA1G11_12674 [Hyphomicrobiales bacterium]|nr:hypothetical protein CHELA1G2_11632 [Hyphomicrobiales bacterium]CAH1666332.1 hypothetical protein CHELA1G11_12674 [Hyphomicrobiales bacterium]
MPPWTKGRWLHIWNDGTRVRRLTQRFNRFMTPASGQDGRGFGAIPAMSSDSSTARPEMAAR